MLLHIRGSNSYYTLAISYCTFCVGKHTILGPGSSSVVTLARPPTRSSLKLPVVLFATHHLTFGINGLDLPLLDSSLLHNHLTSPVSSSPLLSSITLSFFHSNSKLSYFSNPTLHRHLAPLRTDFTDTRTPLRLFFCFSFF